MCHTPSAQRAYGRSRSTDHALVARCQRCGKDISVEWTICALSQMDAESKFFVWEFLRGDKALREFRDHNKQAKTIT